MTKKTDVSKLKLKPGPKRDPSLPLLLPKSPERRKILQDQLFSRKSSHRGWVKYALGAAKQRAKKLNVEFSLTPEDVFVPDFCPALGVKLIFGQRGGQAGSSYSPSLDRLDGAKGYVKGNVRVISTRANRIKNSATLQEIRGILQYMERELGDEEV